MKIAHVIMAYKNPAQVERLIRSMDHPECYFFLHLDAKIDIESFEYLKHLDRVRFISNRVLCNWGGYSFVRAIISSLNEILEQEEHFDFLNLMSGQDYPIKPIQDIYNHYLNNIGKCFISYDEDPKRVWWNHAVKRIALYHFTDFTFKGKYLLQGFMNRFFPKRRFPMSVEFYGSSDSSWWTISEDCARYLVEFVGQNPKLEKFMEYTWGADEFLIATIIMNSPFKQHVVNDNLRFITWSDGIANPRILRKEDYEAIKASNKLFARKFDLDSAPEILDMLDASVLQQHYENK